MIGNGNAHKLCMCIEMNNTTIAFYHIVIKLSDSLSGKKKHANVFFLCLYVVCWIKAIQLFESFRH